MGGSKKILVISANPFSNTKNNGKTLFSFFKDYSKENIYQLYFDQSIPEKTGFKFFYRISDRDCLKSFLKINKNCGGSIYNGNDKFSNENTCSQKKISIPKNSFTRLCREIVRKYSNWNNSAFNNWLEKINPDLVFFMAGDGIFSYEICKYISKKYHSKLVVYITDDYILPQVNISPFFWIKRMILLKKMKNIIKSSDLFLTISPKMQQEYKKIFHKESKVISNIPDFVENNSTKKNNDYISLVYLGGLHFKRDNTLIKLSQAIEKYNKKNSKKAFLSIYSLKRPKLNILKKLNKKGVSAYKGGLNSEEVKKVLNECDIPVHVESFDRKSIASTKLSLSTKISEYMSLKKCILAIGPKQIASMEFLKGDAFCINNTSEIETKLEYLLKDNKLRKEISKKVYTKYQSYNDEILKSRMDILQLIEM